MNTRHTVSIGSLAGLSLMVAATCWGTTAFPIGSYESGGITIEFGSDGRVHVLQAGKSVVEGTYKTDGDKLTFTDVSGSFACPKDQASGTYTWKIETSGLTLTKVDDPCDDRSSDLTGRAWKKH